MILISNSYTQERLTFPGALVCLPIFRVRGAPRIATCDCWISELSAISKVNEHFGSAPPSQRFRRPSGLQAVLYAIDKIQVEATPIQEVSHHKHMDSHRQKLSRLLFNVVIYSGDSMPSMLFSMIHRDPLWKSSSSAKKESSHASNQIPNNSPVNSI